MFDYEKQEKGYRLRKQYSNKNKHNKCIDAFVMLIFVARMEVVIGKLLY